MKKTGRVSAVLYSMILCAALCTQALSGCSGGDGGGEDKTDTNPQGTQQQEEEMKPLKVTVDENDKYQTIESFGASGAWWSQAVGGWTGDNGKGTEVREEIASLLFDKEKGIGLTAYRYNIGAGTADSGASYDGITDVWRRAHSFETEAGVYDWTRDANAVWFMDRAMELGVNELVFFCNSPLERLTKNGKGYGDKARDGQTTSNLPEENYRAFAEYVMDVVEHFKSEGYPIKYVSPVNEPQWEWTGGQEGCHFEPDELVKFLNVFLDVMEERNIEGVELSAPELGEWGNTSYPYYEAIFADERLKNAITTLDVHSYWTDPNTKSAFRTWLGNNGQEGLTLKMSEWCEMKNGMDLFMDSAINLAKEMYYDLTKLDVTSWQYWIAVSCYDYRDGLIYVDKITKRAKETKRLWAMGNYSRFILNGYTRVGCDNDNMNIMSSAYVGKDENENENLVIVLINDSDNGYRISADCFGDWKSGEVYVTDAGHSLEKTEEVKEGGSVTVPAESVVTVTLTK